GLPGAESEDSSGVDTDGVRGEVWLRTAAAGRGHRHLGVSLLIHVACDAAKAAILPPLIALSRLAAPRAIQGCPAGARFFVVRVHVGNTPARQTLARRTVAVEWADSSHAEKIPSNISSSSATLRAALDVLLLAGCELEGAS